MVILTDEINTIISIRTFPDKVVKMGGDSRGVNSGMILTNFAARFGRLIFDQILAQ